jgi:c-di-GMP-binding flagellar brake protein YcgR
MFQRRKFPRVGQEYRISYATIKKEEFTHTPLQSLAINISGGGVCFAAREALAKDTLLALEINAEDSSTILALARVAWCKHKGASYDVGAEFWWIGWRDSTAQSTMADFITTATATRPAAAEHLGAQ